MLDPKLLRSDLNAVAESLQTKGYTLDCEAFLALEAQRKALQLAAEKCAAGAQCLLQIHGQDDWCGKGRGGRCRAFKSQG